MATVDLYGSDGLWQGSSGQIYALIEENLERFSLRDNHLYLILASGALLWAGAPAELVTDPASRQRFRRALARASHILRLAAPTEDGVRLSTIVDIEGGAPLVEAGVQAA